MGEVVSLSERRSWRTSRTGRAGNTLPVSFFFDLASPYTYLAAERVDRRFTGVTWVPVLAPTADRVILGHGHGDPAARLAAEHRACVLRMPLVWPDETPTPARAAMRVAHHAAETGRAAPFVLAATRLAFCGGFDLDDPAILAEAAAAAGLSLDACMAAAGDGEIDVTLRAAGERLGSSGPVELPALEVGGTRFDGEHRLPEAVACARGASALPLAAGPLTPTAG